MFQMYSIVSHNFLKFILAVLGLCCHVVFSLDVASVGCSLVEVHRLITAVPSLVADHKL